MARKPRIVVVAGQPLHVIQRGNDRQAVFYADEDYQRYPRIKGSEYLKTNENEHGKENHGVNQLKN